MTTKLKKLTINGVVFLSTFLIALSIFSSSFFNLDNLKVSAIGNNNADLIIGQTDSANAVEVSVCIKTDDTTLHLADASTWLKYDTTGLTPNPTIVDLGAFSSGSYLPLEWKAVGGSTDMWTMKTTFTGGTGNQISTTSTSDYVGKVSFNKTGSGPKTISLTKSLYFSTEEPATSPINFTITNVTGDCRGAVVATPTAGSSTSTVSGTVGGAFPNVLLTGSNMPNGTIASFLPAGSTTPITGTIVNGAFVPTAGQTIPASALTGNRTGVLTVTGSTPNTINVATNFSAAAVTPTPTPSAPNTNSGSVIVIDTTTKTNKPADKVAVEIQANPTKDETPVAAKETPKDSPKTTTTQTINSSNAYPSNKTVTTGGSSFIQGLLFSILIGVISMIGSNYATTKKKLNLFLK
jgi:hypothetical protein